MTKLLLFFKFVGRFILSTVIIIGVYLVCLLIFHDTIKEADNFVYTFILGSITGTLNVYIVYLIMGK